MYLWTILKKSDDELVRKVYNAQKQFRVQDDWIEDIEEDLDDFGIEFDEGKISRRKNSEKLSGLSSHYGLKDYLGTERLTTEEKQLLFNLRTRMTNVRTNYRRK